MGPTLSIFLLASLGRVAMWFVAQMKWRKHEFQIPLHLALDLDLSEPNYMYVRTTMTIAKSLMISSSITTVNDGKISRIIYSNLLSNHTSHSLMILKTRSEAKTFYTQINRPTSYARAICAQLQNTDTLPLISCLNSYVPTISSGRFWLGSSSRRRSNPCRTSRATWSLHLPNESNLVESLQTISGQERVFSLLKETVLFTLLCHLEAHKTNNIVSDVVSCK